MNFWERIKLKLIAEHWEEYGHLKYTRIAKRRVASYAPIDISNLQLGDAGRPIGFKHSGNSGDIIYALPLVKKLSEKSSAKFFLNLNQKANYSKSFQHPLGNVMLNQRMAEMLIPLLESQAYITSCEIYENQPFDIDLDKVRDTPIPFSRIHLSRWYSLAFGVNFDLSAPWLKVEAEASSKECIVVARSNRYRGAEIDYSFLKKYSNIQFVGVEGEFEEMKHQIPQLVYRPVKDFLEMASIIAASKLFIGNQSFPFSIAEALKVNRLLEVSAMCPDVCVNGENGREFYFQPHFIKMVESVMQ